jgi:hypothetical protein
MLNVKINTKNAAFDEYPNEECARLLDEVANKLRDGKLEGILHDLNGNPVGHFQLTKH